MNKRLFKLLPFLFVLILSAPKIFSESTTSDSPKSPAKLQQEPHHHLKLENEYVRVWDTLIPAKESTLWHVHSHDNVVLTLSNADVRVETVGADPAESHVKLGDVGFRKAPYVHRTMSIGETDFHNMAIELLHNRSISKNQVQTSVPTARPAVVDNEQVRVYRISLPPGESTGKQTGASPGLLVAMTSGDLEISEQSKSDSVRFAASDVRWRSKPVTQTIKNVGKTRFEGVDIELKE